MPSRPTPRTFLRWLAWTAALLAVSALVLWILPSLLTRHPHVQGAERHNAVAVTRVGIVAYLVAVGTAVTVAYTARTYRLTARTYQLTQTGQVTDRYTKAIGQLGDAARDVRIGAIYALERIAKDSPDDHPTIMDVLTAFVLEHTPVPQMSSTDEPPTPDDKTSPPEPSADVQAALTVIARRTPQSDERPTDLRRADLTRTKLTRARLGGAHLDHATLTRADLTRATLTDTTFGFADLPLASPT